MRHAIVEGPCCPTGTLRVPGDKSISHRLALLTLFTDGWTMIDGFLESEDCLHTLAAVQRLGAELRRDGTTINVRGAGGRLRAPDGPLDMGNSGTGMRLLAGILAAQPFVSVMTGDASLSARPMRRIAEPLQQMGARLSLTGERGCAPVTIHGGGLNAISYRLPVASAQVKSCILLAGLFANDITTVVEPLPSRDHTERLLQMAGAPIRVAGDTITIAGNRGAALKLKAQSWRVPGDFSSAAFWIAAATAPGADLCIERVGLNPRRTAFLDWMRRLGATVDVVPEDDSCGDTGEPMGSIRIRGNNLLRGAETGGTEIPNLIDELPLVAVTGALAEGVSRIRDAAELRVKESDRIAVMARNLKLMGVRVQEYPDGMRIEGCGGRVPGGCSVDSDGDHRVAMAMAVIAGFARRPVTIRNSECTETSYPGFWQTMQRMGAHVQNSRCG